LFQQVNKMVKVLFVEADADLRHLISQLLTFSDHQVTTTSNGRAALALLQADSYHPDVILSDLLLDSIQSIELLEAVRSQAKWGEIAFIILATRPQLVAFELELTVEVDGYVSKPFAMKDLLMTIQRALVRRQRADDNSQSSMGTTPRLA
jgi:DNA-binding response OmpR family regulator